MNSKHPPRPSCYRTTDYGIVGDWNEYLPALVEHGLA